MASFGWIYFQSKASSGVASSLTLVEVTHVQPLDVGCYQMTTSCESLRDNACALLAAEDPKQLSGRGLEIQQSNKYQVMERGVVCGYLVIINRNLARPPITEIQSYFNDHIAPELKSSKADKKVTDKTKKIVQFTALGFTTKEIANAFFLTSRGVDYHLELAKRNLGAKNKSAMVFLAMQQGWFA